jgi:hypothetical protein
MRPGWFGNRPIPVRVAVTVWSVASLLAFATVILDTR